MKCNHVWQAGNSIVDPGPNGRDTGNKMDIRKIVVVIAEQIINGPKKERKPFNKKNNSIYRSQRL